MFKKILIANRGEIALRVVRACREMGIQTVAVHSTADADAMHVRMADESVCIGPPPSSDSYLSIPRSCRPARSPAPRRSTPATASCRRTPISCRRSKITGIKFIGPSAEHIRMMGDKITAKDTDEAAGRALRARLRGRRAPIWNRAKASPPISAIRSSSRRPPAAAGAA
jgi:acetyl-CoA carboxylase biotin carboxylase subunit